MYNFRKLSKDQEKDKMLHLMNYGKVNEDVKKINTATLEHSEQGADGKWYGIVKESNKYYIKVSPLKKTNILTEDFDYIGGFKYRGENEYTSYNLAVKQFELKLMSLKEAYGDRNNIIVEEKDPNAFQQIMTESSLSMRNEIERQRQIMKNSSTILKEDSGIKSYKLNHPGDSESNGKATDPAKQGDPFTDEKGAKYQEDRDSATTSEKPENLGNPFDEGVKGGKEDIGDNKTSKSPKDLGNEDGKKVNDLGKAMDKNGSVAIQSPSGGKVVKVEENKENPTQRDTEIGDNTTTEDPAKLGEPFDNCVNINELSMDDEENILLDTAEDGIGSEDEIQIDDTIMSGDDEPVDQIEIDSELENLESGNEFGEEDIETRIAELEAKIAELEAVIGDEEGSIEGLGDDLEGGNEFGEEDFDFDSMGELGEDEMEENFFHNPNVPDDEQLPAPPEEVTFESNMKNLTLKNGKLIKEDGTVLHDFGKHPGYQKAPFTTPTNANKTTDQENGSEDWNDESVEGEKPFGTQIGKSDPFVKLITDAIIDECVKSGIFKKVDKKKV